MATLDRSLTFNTDTASTDANINAFNPQELEDLWNVIESSSGDDGEEYRDPLPVDDTDSSSSMSPATTMVELLQQHGDVSKGSSSGTIGAPKQKPRKFTPAQVDMRRKRNRDSMRRVRQRKQIEVDVLRKKMELLQDKLEELRIVREQATASIHSSGRGQSPSSSKHARSNVDVQELLEEIKALQCEQVRLHNTVLAHQQVSAALVQIIDESKALHFNSESVYANLHQDEDEFQWVNDVLPLLPPLSRSNVYELVRQSYLDIMERLKTAASSGASTNKVLGWSDRRVVNGKWADFLFGKDFVHEDMDALVEKTWKVLTYTNQNDGFQSQGLHLKILEKLNDDALILARTTFFPGDRRYYSSIYVLLRVKTADGYVIGGRTICPLPENEARMKAVLGENRSYSHMFYGLMFSGLGGATDAVHGESPRGCKVKYGGRIGNGSGLYAQTWAMDVLLAVLRWETACVGPFYRLTT